MEKRRNRTNINKLENARNENKTNTSEFEKKSSFMTNEDHVSNVSGAKAKYNRVYSNTGRYQRDNFDFKCGSSHFSRNGSDTSDEYASSDFSKPSFNNFARAKNSHEFSYRQSNARENLYTSVNDYKSSKNSFLQIYKIWAPKREVTIAKLQSLYEEVLSNHKEYNTIQADCKGFSSEMRREVIQNETGARHSLASFFGFLSDAASGVSSLAQAFKVDSFQTKFQEIMDQDAEITKEMYETRSRCVTKYQGIEEVMRKYHSDTFGSTVDKISNTLQVDKYWDSMKNAYENDDTETLINTVGKFLDNFCQSEVLGEVGNAVNRYVADNPAALDTCKSTGKAVYGAVNTWAPNRNGRGKTSRAANCYLMYDDMEDAHRFRSAADKDCHGNKLLMKIKDALDSLQSELKEMKEIYLDYFKKKGYRAPYNFQ